MCNLSMIRRHKLADSRLSCTELNLRERGVGLPAQVESRDVYSSPSLRTAQASAAPHGPRGFGRKVNEFTCLLS